ncbi:MAG: YpdA family putative bacillithiol disulfide reductase [Bacteroidota bacterium]|nr:YpdA family putative bacillithiol disulfide reductase [Bacteroidota bacterium]
MNRQYTLIIIGGGPIGLACALEAAKKGIDYLIIEKGALVNSLYNYPVNMTFFSTSERLEIGNVPFVTNNPKPRRVEALEYYRRVTQDNKISIHLFEEVISVMPSAITTGPSKEDNDQQTTGSAQQRTKYTITTNKAVYTTHFIIIATGFYDIPFLLNIPGENLPKVKHYYDDPHYYAFQKVVIVGAQNSAIDAALETWRKGAEVTMIIRGSEVGQRVKYWVRPDIENRIKEGSIKAYFNSYLKEITTNEVVVSTPAGEVKLANDWVLSLTGYQPDLSFLEKMGIMLSDDVVRKPLYDEETHETNVAGIYLAGVICGGMNTHRLFIENSREHAVKILAHITKNLGRNAVDLNDL